MFSNDTMRNLSIAKKAGGPSGGFLMYVARVVTRYKARPQPTG